MKCSSSCYYLLFCFLLCSQWDFVLSIPEASSVHRPPPSSDSLNRAFSSFLTIRTPTNRSKPKNPPLISINLDIGAGLGGNPGILGILG